MSEELCGQREAFMRGHDAGVKEGIEYALNKSLYSALSFLTDRDRAIKDSVDFLYNNYKQEKQNAK